MEGLAQVMDGARGPGTDLFSCPPLSSEARCGTGTFWKGSQGTCGAESDA